MLHTHLVGDDADIRPPQEAVPDTQAVSDSPAPAANSKPHTLASLIPLPQFWDLVWDHTSWGSCPSGWEQGTPHTPTVSSTWHHSPCAYTPSLSLVAGNQFTHTFPQAAAIPGSKCVEPSLGPVRTLTCSSSWCHSLRGLHPHLTPLAAPSPHLLVPYELALWAQSP